MATNPNALNFPTKDRVITLNLTFLDFELIVNSMMSISTDFQSQRKQAGRLSREQETLLTMINGVLDLIHNQAGSCTENLSADRVSQELDYSQKYVTPFFMETFSTFHIEKIRSLLEQSRKPNSST